MRKQLKLYLLLLLLFPFMSILASNTPVKKRIA